MKTPNNTAALAKSNSLRIFCKKYWKIITTCSLLIIFSIGYHMRNDRVSTDIIALQKIVELGIAAKSGKWEMFGTPEYTGGVPGPTDYITLIAELTSFDEKLFLANLQAEEIWIAPESARPWLSENFRLMLAKQKNLVVDFSKNGQCRSLPATLKETSEKLKGLICEDGGRVLIYLRIADYSKP